LQLPSWFHLDLLALANIMRRGLKSSKLQLDQDSLIKF
jgi:hypothetical protein